MLVLGLQGSVVGVHGAEQTWFITSLMFCYLLTPIIRFLVLKACKFKEMTIMYTALFLLIPSILSFIPSAFVYTLFIPCCWYALAYLIGYKFNMIKLTSKEAFCSFITIIFAFSIRVIMKMYLDGSY